MENEKNRTFWKIGGCLLSGILWIEGVFRVLSGYSLWSLEVVQIILFSITISLLLTVLMQYWKTILAKIGILIVVLGIGIYTLLQLNFKSFMGNYMSLSAAGGGGIGRVTTEIGPFIRAIHPSYFLVFVPFIVLLILFILRRTIFKKEHFSYRKAGIFVLVLVLFHFGSIAFLKIDDKHQLRSNTELYASPTLIDLSIQKFGTTRFLWRDFITNILPKKEELMEIPTPEEEIPVVTEPDWVRSIDDTEWEQLIAKEKDPVIKNIHQFLKGQPITPKNEMTGIFKDKNLVLVMVEAFDLSAIQEELTPTLYKLKQEGWFFDHYYTPKYSCTTGESEFIGEMSIIPSLTTCTPNAYTGNNYATSIFNLFNQSDYYTTSYHSWRDQFYERTKLHAQMGSQHYYDYDSLKMRISSGWPSDEQLFEKAFPYFQTAEKQKFFSFVITSSMHFPYDEDSEVVSRYWNLVKDTKYTDKMKRYLAKVIDFDRGLERLLKDLESKGELENTVIALFGDHHPLNMELSALNEGSPIDRFTDFNEDRMPFLIYNAGTEAKTISKTASTFDILPTLANLFDLEYDPRYYVGKDLFSEEDTIVIFPSGSWITDHAMYFSGKKTYKKLTETADDAYIQKINEKVNNYFTISDRILTKDYFQYRFPN